MCGCILSGTTEYRCQRRSSDKELSHRDSLRFNCSGLKSLWFDVLCAIFESENVHDKISWMIMVNCVKLRKATAKFGV